mgnify:CR=1 FL=1
MPDLRKEDPVKNANDRDPGRLPRQRHFEALAEQRRAAARKSEDWEYQEMRTLVSAFRYDNPDSPLATVLDYILERLGQP